MWRIIRPLIRLVASIMRAWQNKKKAQTIRRERKMNARIEKVKQMSIVAMGERSIYAVQALEVRNKAVRKLQEIDEWEKRKLGL